MTVTASCMKLCFNLISIIWLPWWRRLWVQWGWWLWWWWCWWVWWLCFCGARRSHVGTSPDWRQQLKLKLHYAQQWRQQQQQLFGCFFFAFHYGIFGYTLFRRVCCRFYARICIAFVAVVNAILIMIMKFCWFLRQHPSAICPRNSPFSSTPLPLAVALWFTWLVVGARGVYAMLSFCHGTRLQFHSSGDQSRHLNSYLNYICLYINPPPFCEHFHLHSPA